MIFFYLIVKLVPEPSMESYVELDSEKKKKQMYNGVVMMIGMTLHNLPEGIAGYIPHSTLLTKRNSHKTSLSSNKEWRSFLWIASLFGTLGSQYSRSLKTFFFEISIWKLIFLEGIVSCIAYFCSNREFQKGNLLFSSFRSSRALGSDSCSLCSAKFLQY